ncbi:hypothetical protein F3J24_17850 [Comamonas sp. Tr-654]|nr:hypothetical protein [Comamonas sp. Tr-654]
MLATTSKPEPSETLKAHPFLMRCYEGGHLSLTECERQAQGSERLKEAFSSTPFYAQRAAKDPDYWSKLYGSRVNW